MNTLTCHKAQLKFSEYLDGAVTGHEMQGISAHLDGCAGCKDEFESLRAMQTLLGSARQMKAPADLGLRLRVAISQERAKREHGWLDRVVLRWQNAVQPLLVQASAGFAGSMVLLGTLALLIGVVAAPQAVMAHDEPLGAMSAPHYQYSVVAQQAVSTGLDQTIVVEASVNALGQVYDYTVVSGPQDAKTLAGVREQLMVQVYEPARVFGQAVRGRVLVTFAGVSVKG